MVLGVLGPRMSHGSRSRRSVTRATWIMTAQRSAGPGCAGLRCDGSAGVTAPRSHR